MIESFNQYSRHLEDLPEALRSGIYEIGFSWKDGLERIGVLTRDSKVFHNILKHLNSKVDYNLVPGSIYLMEGKRYVCSIDPEVEPFKIYIDEGIKNQLVGYNISNGEIYETKTYTKSLGTIEVKRYQDDGTFTTQEEFPVDPDDWPGNPGILQTAKENDILMDLIHRPDQNFYYLRIRFNATRKL